MPSLESSSADRVEARAPPENCGTRPGVLRPASTSGLLEPVGDHRKGQSIAKSLTDMAWCDRSLGFSRPPAPKMSQGLSRRMKLGVFLGCLDGLSIPSRRRFLQGTQGWSSGPGVHYRLFDLQRSHPGHRDRSRSDSSSARSRSTTSPRTKHPRRWLPAARPEGLLRR